MVSWVISETALTALVGTGAAYALMRFPGAWTRLLAVNVALMVIATWTFAIWNRRGLWRPLGETTDSFLRLARLRCRRKLQALRFAVVLLIVQLLFVGVWRAVGPGDAPFARTEATAALPIAVVVVYVVALVRLRRRVTEEMAELDRLDAQLSASLPAEHTW